MEIEVKFILVEDDKSMLMALEKMVKKIYPKSEIVTTEDGLDAWDIIHSQNEPVIIICDMYLPGINGLQLLNKVRTNEKTRNWYFIVFTSNTDQEMNLKTLQQGADDFLVKPILVDNLVAKLRSAVRLTKSQKSYYKIDEKILKLTNELQESKLSIIKLIKRFQEIKLQETGIKIISIAEAAKWIAMQMCDTANEVELIYDAAQLCYIGKMFLGETQIDKPVLINGMLANATMEGVPRFTEEMISYFKENEALGKILMSIYENFDGTGIPKRLKAWEIPLGSRILRVAIDFSELNKKNQGKSNKTIEQLLYEARRLYDYRVVAYYDQYLAWLEEKFAQHGKSRERQAAIRDLRPNFMVTRNIITESGLFLMAAYTTLTEEKIDKIYSIVKNDPIIGKIYIRAQDYDSLFEK